MKNLIGISGKIGSGKDTVGLIIQYLCAGLEVKDIVFYLEDPSRDQTGLMRKGNFEIKKFAGKLKKIVAILSGCDIYDLENQEFKNRVIGPEWDSYRGEKHVMTYRSLLQKVGTEAMRNNIHENVWVNALFADYRKKYTSGHTLVDPKVFDEEEEEDWSTAYPKWIITDCRFPNEAEAIKSRGGLVIRIERPNYIPHGPGIQAHMEGAHPAQHPSETALDHYPFDYTIFNNGTMEELITQVQTILKAEKII